MTTPRIEEMVATIIMQAIAPYHKPYKHLGEKSIDTAKSEIIGLVEKESHQAGIDEAVEKVGKIETIKGRDRHRKPADTGLLRKSEVIKVIKNI